MSDKEKRLKKSIKDTIIDNLDAIVDSIYDSEQLVCPTKEDVIEIISFIRDSVRKDEKRQLDIFLGKEVCPVQSESENQLIEIDIDEICKKIKVANNVFTTLYKFTFYKDCDSKKLTKDMKEILHMYSLCQIYEMEKDYKNLEHSRRWLMSVGLVGHLRYIKKANSPYLLEEQIKKIVSDFFENLQDFYNVVNEMKEMVDPGNKGLTLWGPRDNADITFIKKKIRK